MPAMRRSNGATSAARERASSISSQVSGSMINEPESSTRVFHSNKGRAERTLPLSNNRVISKKHAVGIWNVTCLLSARVNALWVFFRGSLWLRGRKRQRHGCPSHRSFTGHRSRHLFRQSLDRRSPHGTGFSHFLHEFLGGTA